MFMRCLHLVLVSNQCSVVIWFMTDAFWDRLRLSLWALSIILNISDVDIFPENVCQVWFSLISFGATCDFSWFQCQKKNKIIWISSPGLRSPDGPWAPVSRDVAPLNWEWVIYTQLHADMHLWRQEQERMADGKYVCVCAELECATAQNRSTSQETVRKSPCTSQGH